MKLLIIIFLVIFCASCNQPTNKEALINQSGSNRRTQSDTLYARDKIHIAKAFVANVEAIRISKRHYAQNTKSNTAYEDPANIFMPYAIRYNAQSMEYEGSPLPTSKQISVNTDTIVYSPDSLVCVAFITIDNHFADIPPYEPKRRQMGKYDGRALIGYRKC